MAFQQLTPAEREVLDCALSTDLQQIDEYSDRLFPASWESFRAAVRRLRRARLRRWKVDGAAVLDMHSSLTMPNLHICPSEAHAVALAVAWNGVENTMGGA